MRRDQWFVEYQSKLAFQLNKGPSYAAPSMVTVLWVSKQRVTETNGFLVEQTKCYIQDIKGRIISIFTPDVPGVSRYGHIDATDWEPVIIEEPIPMPRNGKEYTWEWERGEWRKQDFPNCPLCYTYRVHDPALSFCEECQLCHKQGTEHLTHRRGKFVKESAV